MSDNILDQQTIITTLTLRHQQSLIVAFSTINPQKLTIMSLFVRAESAIMLYTSNLIPHYIQPSWSTFCHWYTKFEQTTHSDLPLNETSLTTWPAY